jgi:hypothetical protein
MNDAAAWVLGILFGMLTWWLAYCRLDMFFLQNNLQQSSKRLTRGAIGKAFLQLVPYLDIYMGVIAVGISESIIDQLRYIVPLGFNCWTFDEVGAICSAHVFFESWVTTLLLGFLYSLIVLLLFFLFPLIFSPIQRFITSVCTKKVVTRDDNEESGIA